MEIMNPGTSITMLSATYQITGEIDTKLLEQAAAEIVKTYDAFRSALAGICKIQRSGSKSWRMSKPG